MRVSKLVPAVLTIGLLFSTATVVLAVDDDMDSYDSSIDCNDNDPAINPGATEVCDSGNVDEDCDGGRDDADPSVDVSTKIPIYADIDGDGYGSGSSTGNECDPDSGESTTNTDCNDFAASAHPGGVEVCDAGNVNEDCDSGADDADPQGNATGKVAIYTDIDGDGYGAGSTTGNECDPDSGESTNNTDCNDFVVSAHPGGTEVCDGGDVDEDCDGNADDLDLGGAAGQTSWYADGDSDGYGDSSGAGVLACTAPADTVADHTDCDDGDAAAHPGGTETCDAGDRDEDCDSTADDNDPGGASGMTSWFVDSDADGYGVAGGSSLACDAPPGRSSTSGDCDDTDGSISPGDPEVCDAAGVDDDCDSTSDCDDTDCSAAPSCPGTVEVFDHLECFKIKTTEKLKATLDADPGINPPFPLEEGCTIGKATKYCVPIMKTVSVVDASSTLTDNPAYVGQELEDDRICYKVKCVDSPPHTFTIHAVDRFGSRDFTKVKTAEICTPAEHTP